MKTRLAILTIAFIAIVGCEKAPPAPPAALPPTTFGNATITGTVTFVGTPPERRMIDISTCADGAKAYQEETIVVGAGGRLRDVIVYLKDVPASDGSTREPAVLDQIGCRYVPHTLALQVGQPLKVTTSDSVPHNTHWLSEVSGDVNFGLIRAGQSNTMTLTKPEMLRVRCDVHPWMTAAIGVMPSPFFAVTAADGSFTIDRVPAGKYTIAAWHPILGEQTTTAEVAADGTMSLAITFAPPTGS